MSILKPTETPLSFRAGTAKDTALIVSMHVQSWIATYRGIVPDAYLDRDIHAERMAHWQARMPEIEAGAGCVMIVECAGEPAGFVCLVEPDESGSVLVDNLHALPGRKGLGAGTAMLERAARWARERGAREMHLYVLEDNRSAIGFYESRGWKLASRQADNMAGLDLISLRYVMPLA